MDGVNIAEAKAHLSALVGRVEAGETITLLRRGRPVARIVPIEQQPQPLDLEALQRLIDGMPMSDVSAAELVRHMRETDRF